MASGVAAAGAAVAVYFYSRRVRLCGMAPRSEDLAQAAASSHFEGAYQAPSTWVEAMYFFAEALRYMYNESLGRWRTADLLIGLAYLARQESANCAVADIACTGSVVGEGKSREEREAVVDDFRAIAHFMKYCQALRERREPGQAALLARLGVERSDILLQQGYAGMLKPSFVLVRDHRMRAVVLAIRGTHSVKDMFTSLTSASKPHHMLSGSGVILGYSHFGMLAAARWVLQQTQRVLRETLEGTPGYRLQIVGHSLGAGTAALLTTRLREMGGVFSEATCLAIACPACMTMELARSCRGYVTTIINGHDMIPTLSPGAADALREEVMQSSWYEAFRADMRSSVVVRAVEASLGGVGTVTSAATSWTSSGFSAASRSLRACYHRRSTDTLKRSGSDADRLSMVSEPSLDLSAAVGSVQIAREWADPTVEPGSPSWGDVLQMLEPIEADAAAGSRQAMHEPLRASWPTASGREQWQSVGSVGGAEEMKPQSVYRRAGELWSRLFLRGCRMDRRRSMSQRISDSDDAAESELDSLAQPAMTLPMARSGSDGAQLMGAGVTIADLSGEFRAAEAEAEQAAIPLTPPPVGKGEPGFGPAFSGGRADDEAGRGSDDLRDWRRMTYPAGKIYHLVPERLVFGAGSRRRQGTSDEAEELHITCSSGNAESESSATDSANPRLSATHLALNEGVIGGGALSTDNDPFLVIQTRGASSTGIRGLAPPIPPSEEFVLLEDVPQEVYARIRLCSRMLADHFIPAYLGSLESALAAIESGYAKSGRARCPAATSATASAAAASS